MTVYTDRRCLVGIRPLEGGDVDGPENRHKRLIDGAPPVLTQSVMHWDPGESANTNTNTVLKANGTPDGAGDKSGSEHALPGNSTFIEGRDSAADDVSFWPSIAFAFVVGALGLWFGFGWFGLVKVRRSSPRWSPVIVDVPTPAIRFLTSGCSTPHSRFFN
jgi:serine/threonine-protein kinase/endoribonuclease IRE1